MDEVEPLVSIVMPAFNAEKTIAESIRSVLSQSYKNWQLIVVNDGSYDNTANVVDSFLVDRRITLLSQVNSGVAAARNSGLSNAKGEFIAFLDSDDLWYPNKLKQQIGFFEGLGDGAGLIYSNCRMFWNDPRISEQYPISHLPIETDMFSELVLHDYIPTLTVVIKKACLDQVGRFDESLRGTEDWDLWIRVAERYSVFHQAVDLALYRRSPNGITANRLKHLYNETKVFEKHKSKLSGETVKLAKWQYHYKRLAYYLEKRSPVFVGHLARMVIALGIKKNIMFLFYKISRFSKYRNYKTD